MTRVHRFLIAAFVLAVAVTFSLAIWAVIAAGVVYADKALPGLVDLYATAHNLLIVLFVMGLVFGSKGEPAFRFVSAVALFLIHLSDSYMLYLIEVASTPISPYAARSLHAPQDAVDAVLAVFGFLLRALPGAGLNLPEAAPPQLPVAAGSPVGSAWPALQWLANSSWSVALGGLGAVLSAALLRRARTARA